MLVSLFLPFWAGVSILNGVYDMWVGVPMQGLYGLTQVGPQTTVDVGWTTWVDVMVLSLGVILIFAAGIVGFFRSTVGGILGITGGLMMLLGFIGFPQIMYFWVWGLVGPAFFLMCIGAVICLISQHRSQIWLLLTQNKRVVILPVVAVLLTSSLIVSMHFRAVAVDKETNYYDENLRYFLPNSSDTEARRAFLMSLDVFIQKRYQELPKFVEYSAYMGRNFPAWSLVRLLQMQVQRIVKEINETTVESGIIVWRVYNAGFVVKTRNLTIGFDVACTWLCPKIAEIADLVDLLFVSHLHGDHADVEVLRRAAMRGVKIIAPAPELERVAMYLTQLPLNASQHVPVYDGESINVSGVQVRAFLGPHGITNYAYLVELPEGVRLLHTGDTEHFEDVTWVDDLANEEQIDIVFIHTAALTNVPREAITIPILAKRHEKLPLGRPFSETPLKPRIIVPMHENELGHRFTWVSTWNLNLAYRQLDELNSLTTQVVILAWGQRMSLEQ